MSSTIKVNNIQNLAGDDSGIDLSTNDQIILKTANTTAITVDSSQNTSVAGDLTIPDKIIHDGDTNTAIRFPSADTVTFETGGSERARVDSSGNLLVGSSSFVGGTSVCQIESNGTIDIGCGTTASTIRVGFFNANGLVGNISTSGSATSYSTSSDHRLKENVDYTFDATTRLKQLKPARFNFIADADTTVDGFLAHEVQSVVPEAITGTHNEVDDDGNAVMQGIDQSKLVPLLVKTIQELEARITALENG